DAALLELAHEAPHVVEVAVAGVAVQQDRDGGDIRHELEHVHHLRPAGLVVVAHAELRGDGEAAGPDALEAGLLDDAGGDAVVGLEKELELRRVEQLAQLAGAAHGRLFDDAGLGSHYFPSNGRAGIRGNTSSRARVTSSGKSISIQGRPLTSST